jgi:hypothetical protein
VHRRCVSPLLAPPEFQSRLQFPDRRGSRPTTVPPLIEFKDGHDDRQGDG